MHLTCAGANKAEKIVIKKKKKALREMHSAELMTTHVLTTTENNFKLCKKVQVNYCYRQFTVTQNMWVKRKKDRKKGKEFCQMCTLPFVFGVAPF